MELIIKPVILNYIIKDDGYYDKIVDKLVEMVDLHISDDSDNYSVSSSGSSGSSSAPPNSLN